MPGQIGKYKTYRDSGVDWIGEIPADWAVSRLKFLFREANARTSTGKEKLYSLRMNEGLVPHEDVSEKQIDPRDLVDYKIISPGQMVMNRMRAAIGVFGVASDTGLVSPDYAIFDVAPQVDAQFFLWAFKTTLMGMRFRLASKGMGTGSQGFMRLYTEEFNDIKVAVPPLRVQREIVQSIEEKTAEIDGAIAKKRRLIELLEEQKSILINRSVTQGLDPSVPMKDSGVDWIGEIPAHWEMPPLYSRFRVQLGKMLDHSKITGKSSVPYLRNTDVQWGKINLDDLPEMDITEVEYDRYTVRTGDLLVCEGGEIGRAAICWLEGNPEIGFQKALHRLRPHSSEDEDIEYTYYVFYAAGFRSAFQSIANTSTISHLTSEMIRKIRLPKPPIYEQLKIVNILKNIELKFFNVIRLEQHAINNLNEFKQTLIANAVTGKIKI